MSSVRGHPWSHDTTVTAQQFQMLTVQQPVVKLLDGFAEVDPAFSYQNIAFHDILRPVDGLQQSPADGENGTFTGVGWIKL